jgi:1,4-alpha-glucan branching enzyme
MADLSTGIDELLPGWLISRRWYVGKGRAPRLRRSGGVQWLSADGDALLETLFVVDESGPEPVTYQVPLTYRAEPVDALHTALVGRVEDVDDGLGTRYVYDAVHDPAFIQAVLDLIDSESTVTTTGADPSGATASGGTARGHLVGRGGNRAVVRRCAVLSGEQSNTSIIVETEGPEPQPLIIKVFRVLQAGDNPDVAVQSALAQAGSVLVPRPLGFVSGRWPAPAGSEVAGHLAFAQEFLPGVQDAWRTALAAAEAEQDFTGRTRELGEATAAVHATLREAFGTEPMAPEARDGLLQRMRRRHEAAVTEVPELSRHREEVEELYAAAAATDWPALQRVHGDYHLGQVLDVPDRGWVLVDFEGEPLRALEERNAPDLPLRDVAGMLRSFDYAAGSVGQERDLDRESWATACRTAFLDGYAAQAGEDPRDHADLLDALELDKALYEVVYEARNRPTWIGIPVAAIDRILARRRTPAPAAGAGPSSPPPPAAAPEPQDVAVEEAPLAEAVTEPEGAVPGDRRPEPRPLDQGEVARLLRGQHRDPHAVLGAHLHDGGVTIRALRPLAASVTVVLPGERREEMWHETHGIWTVALDLPQVPDYRFEVQWGDGVVHRQDDPYRFLPTLGEMDRHLIAEGRHEQLWTVLGAHVRVYDGPLGRVWGTSFAVWAPNAQGVHVVGDFNQWDNAAHPMRHLGDAGVWELFVPGVGEGTRYKFDITGADGQRRLKADPMARAAERPPASASVVHHSRHEWGDGEWMQRRAQTDPHTGPMSVYEVHLASWRQGLSYRELADQLVAYLGHTGFTHVEFMPVMQHPYGPSWGYHVTGYYAADSRLGSPDDLKYLIDRLHQAGVGVILDWVPGHFATDPWALARFDGTPLYEHPDPRRGWHPEWGSYIFDFGRREVRNFLVANALYWMEEFHADGLRVDGVASMLYLDYSRGPGQWVPNRHGGRENLEAVELLQETNATAYRRIPGVITVAEESTSWPGVTRRTDQGGLGFGLKWNMGWMHDSLDYLARQPVYRQYHHHQLTFSLMYAFNERFLLPISHDEVVHGKGSLLRKMPGDRWQQLANLRAYLAFMWAHPGKQLLFMGQEFAQESEWADGRSLDWWLLDQPAHAGVLHLVRDLNGLYRDTPALWEVDHDSAGFQWLNADDVHGNTYSFVRYGKPGPDGQRRVLAAIANFGGSPRPDVRVGLPLPGRWREVLNTDAGTYGGSGVGNLGGVTAEEQPQHGQPWSAVLTLPPLGVLWLTPEELPADAGDAGPPEAETRGTDTERTGR